MVVGLAPGLRGANRTGRPFTGDFAGEVLYPTLQRHGFADGHLRGPDRRTGFELVDCRDHQRGALRAAGQPPDAGRDRDLPPLPGRRADRGCGARGDPGPGPHRPRNRCCGPGLPLRRPTPSAMARARRCPAGRLLVASFHTSRYNVNTGRLTVAMFEAVVARLAALLQPSRRTAPDPAGVRRDRRRSAAKSARTRRWPRTAGGGSGRARRSSSCRASSGKRTSSPCGSRRTASACARLQTIRSVRA